MDPSANTVDIQVCQVENLDCLKLSFNGILTEAIANQAIDEWKHLLGNVGDKKVNMVWDCKNMKDYETGARIKWQNMLKENKQVIGTIWVITESSLIKTGLKLLSAFSSYKFKFIKSCEEILKEEYSS